ncbi:MAG: hypothetical protein MJZ38_04120 [archaeon]|nr:hypothetical protein [archaeon]
MRTDSELVREAAEEGRRILAERHPLLAGRELDNLFSTRFDRWERETGRRLEQNLPIKEELRELENSERDLAKGVSDRESLREDLSRLSKVDEGAAAELTESLGKASEEELPAVHERIVSEWSEELERRRAEWTMEVIERRRNELADSREGGLGLIGTARKATESLGIGTGVLWDLTENAVTPSEAETLERWADTFRDDPNVRHICETLGRMCSFEIDGESEEELPVGTRTYIPDCSSSEEIIGLELGHSIEDVLPSELMLLRDPDLEVLFNQRFIENRLLCFSKQGNASVESDYVMNARRTEKETARGPIVFCMDTSGSMNGTPERIAKAFAFYVAMRAMNEGRSCFMINFSVGTETLDLTPPRGFPELLRFMGGSFHGGTDIRPAMELAVRTTLTEEYRLADIVVISDFVVPPNSFDFLRSDMDSAREHGCRFHSVSIGNFVFAPKLTDIFDECWEYNTVTGAIDVHRPADL